jgi:hypothetical protein
LDEGETLGGARGRADLDQVGALARRVVVIVQIVEPDDAIAAFEQCHCGVATNEAG